MTPQTSPKRSTPDVILDVAMDLMLKEGYHGVAVDSIIQASGVSKGTFFYHFKSKEALAERLLEKFTATKATIIRQLISDLEADDPNPKTLVFRFLVQIPKLYRTFDESNGCLLASFSYQLLNEMPQLRTFSQDTYKGWQQIFSQLIQQAVQCSDDDARSLSRMLFCLVEGSFIAERISGKEEFDTQMQLFSNYLQLLQK